jgi:hypothetical protein
VVKVLYLDANDNKSTDQADLLEFVLDTTISDWESNLREQQMVPADDANLTTEQALVVAATMHDNLETLKLIRKNLDG